VRHVLLEYAAQVRFAGVLRLVGCRQDERFFQPPQIRTENTPEVIAYHLARDPNLTDAAAEKIAGLVRELYASLASADLGVRVHLRAAATFTPEASRKLGELLEQMQRKLTVARPNGR
jgi:hypothetical protein